LYSVLVFDADAGADIANPLVHGSENGVEDPIGIVEDGKGHIFVANEGLGITEFDALTGTRIDTPPLGFSPAWGLAMDSSGYLYEAGGGTVGKMDSVTGEGTSLFITGLTDPQFIAIAPLPEPGWLLAAALALPSLLARRRRRNPAAPVPGLSQPSRAAVLTCAMVGIAAILGVARDAKAVVVNFDDLSAPFNLTGT
jgi:hypothetical protein